MTDEQQTPTQDEIKELHKKWVEALRSGEYKQTQSKLHNEEGFCCIGVLCEVKGMESMEKDDGSFSYYMPRSKENQTSWIPNCDLIDFGLDRKVVCSDDFDPEDLFEEAVDSVLMQMNDGGKTFDEIADYIEKELIND